MCLSGRGIESVNASVLKRMHAWCVQGTAGKPSCIKYSEREKRWGQRQVLGKGHNL